MNLSRHWSTINAAGLIAIALCHSQARGYTGIALYPLVAPAGMNDVVINTVPDVAAGGWVAGQVLDNKNNPHAVLFTPSQPTGIDLGFGDANATDGSRVVGYSRSSSTVAASPTVWSGSPPTPTTLSASSQVSYAYGVAGSQILGMSTVPITFQGARGPTNVADAGYWPTPSTFVDLTLGAFGATGTAVAWNSDGTQQVGYGGTSQAQVNALLWSGTAASMVNLNPSGFLSSKATAVSNGYQVGYGLENGIGTRALLWHGLTASVVDLTPSGFGAADANGINGNTEVGYGSGNSTANHSHALLWQGSSLSAVDLGALLPGTISNSYADTVDSLEDVYGVGSDSTGTYYALEWLPTAPIPGDANLDGKVDQTDLIALTTGQGQGLIGWSHGDFNQDGVINSDDWALFSLGVAITNAQSTPTPEPAAAWTVAIFSVLLSRGLKKSA